VGKPLLAHLILDLLKRTRPLNPGCAEKNEFEPNQPFRADFKIES
jgi:hypothetical protein